MKDLKSGLAPLARSCSIWFSALTISLTSERSWEVIRWIDCFMPWNIWSSICCCSFCISSSNFCCASGTMNS